MFERMLAHLNCPIISIKPELWSLNTLLRKSIRRLPWSVTIPYPMAILITQYPGRRMKLFSSVMRHWWRSNPSVYFAGRLAPYRYYNMD